MSDDQIDVADDLVYRGLLAHQRGDHAQAERLYERALEHGAPEVAATASLQLGLLAHERGEHAAAERLYQQALAHARASGHQQHAETSLHQLGLLAHERGEHATLVSMDID